MLTVTVGNQIPVPTAGAEDRTTLRPRTDRFSQPSLNGGNTLTAALGFVSWTLNSL